ncbi:MAG: hypothetical protein F8N36_13705 [Desulfovibrio sp.]|uniref:hypothetical protein n=1 Tax=Desulfovibrio sp. TaxID=885 RepID=UPI00135DB9D8|nr:hypothetical protein [Desulfovibrio sp.]MTJ93894.1 hypothetical protein [Desulfovibrio sp.]
MAPITPGTWNVTRTMGGELAPFSAKGEHLLSSEGPLPLEERQANGRLIQNAPALLALVRQVAVPGGIGPHEFTRPGGWLERATLALAKIDEE